VERTQPRGGEKLDDISQRVSDLCRATRGAEYSSFPVPNSNSLSRPFQGRFEHFFLEGKGLNDRSDDLVVPDLRGKGR
jgi:hypothetical protein